MTRRTLWLFATSNRGFQLAFSSLDHQWRGHRSQELHPSARIRQWTSLRSRSERLACIPRSFLRLQSVACVVKECALDIPARSGQERGLVCAQDRTHASALQQWEQRFFMQEFASRMNLQFWTLRRTKHSKGRRHKVWACTVLSCIISTLRSRGAGRCNRDVPVAIDSSYVSRLKLPVLQIVLYDTDTVYP